MKRAIIITLLFHKIDVKNEQREEVILSYCCCFCWYQNRMKTGNIKESKSYFSK